MPGPAPSAAVVVEALAGLAGVGYASAAGFGLLPDGASVAGALLACVALLAVAVVDVRALVIPDGASLMFAGAALGNRLMAGSDVAPWVTLAVMAAQALLVGGAFWAVREVFYRLKGFDGLGFGDVKLAAAGGLAVGALGMSVVVLIASLAGLLVAGLLRLSGRRDGAALRLPFGALLAAPLLAVSLFDPDGTALLALLGGRP